jgi:hypothetical protein
MIETSTLGNGTSSLLIEDCDKPIGDFYVSHYLAHERDQYTYYMDHKELKHMIFGALSCPSKQELKCFVLPQLPVREALKIPNIIETAPLHHLLLATRPKIQCHIPTIHKVMSSSTQLSNIRNPIHQVDAPNTPISSHHIQRASATTTTAHNALPATPITNTALPDHDVNELGIASLINNSLCGTGD